MSQRLLWVRGLRQFRHISRPPGALTPHISTPRRSIPGGRAPDAQTAWRFSNRIATAYGLILGVNRVHTDERCDGHRRYHGGMVIIARKIKEIKSVRFPLR